jgi:hypothetical protein
LFVEADDIQGNQRILAQACELLHHIIEIGILPFQVIKDCRLHITLRRNGREQQTLSGDFSRATKWRSEKHHTNSTVEYAVVCFLEISRLTAPSPISASSQRSDICYLLNNQTLKAMADEK